MLKPNFRRDGAHVVHALAITGLGCFACVSVLMEHAHASVAGLHPIVVHVSALAAGQSSASSTTTEATASSAAAPATLEDRFPRNFTLDIGTATVYPPNFSAWDGRMLTGTCAMGITRTGASSQQFGTLAFTANTEVNRMSRIVTITDIQLTGVSLPESPAAQQSVQQQIQAQSQGRPLRIALDRLEAAVPSMRTGPSVPTAPLRNNPPALSVVSTPTVLVPIQGKPVLAPLPGTGLQRVQNTSMLLVKDRTGAWWLKIADGWMTARSLDGPWTVGTATADLDTAQTWANAQPQINLLAPSAGEAAMQQSNQSQTVSLATLVPAIKVTTEASEIVVTQGDPAWSPIAQSGLSYVTNTSGNVFRLDASGACYVLVSGRWFTSQGLGGPWSYVPAAGLPNAFMSIPTDSPKENVLASIPGTPQAQEAAIANRIPQMARVPLTETLPPPTLIGSLPSWKPIPHTLGPGSVEVLANCTTPIFRTAPYTLWAVDKGVWFTAREVQGPWTVAKWVAPILYTIPPSSPYYYVTFVRIYSTTSDDVLVGYTPGYFGAYEQDGVVVYGTGYWYDPYCVGGWVPVPMTYGCGANMMYNPWAGWAFGFGSGMAVGWMVGESTWCCGPYPYWGPYGEAYGPHGAVAWGPGGWVATTGNVYHQWGNVSTMSRTSGGYNAWTGNAWETHTGTAYNSATGARAAGQRGVVENAYTGNWTEGARGAGYNPTTGNYAAGTARAAGTSDGTSVVAGAGTVGNTKTGDNASVVGVKTDNGAWGVAKGPDGTAVSVGNNVYATHDGGVYKYDDSSSSWQQYDKGNWNGVNDQSTRGSLDDQAATRSDGDWRSNNAGRWQPGGDGFAGRSDGASSSGDRSWGGAEGGQGAGRFQRAGGFGGGAAGGGFRGGGGRFR